MSDQRWARLVELEAIASPRPDIERRWRAHRARTDTTCAAEVAVHDQLHRWLDDAPIDDQVARRIAMQTLAVVRVPPHGDGAPSMPMLGAAANDDQAPAVVHTPAVAANDGQASVLVAASAPTFDVDDFEADIPTTPYLRRIAPRGPSEPPRRAAVVDGRSGSACSPPSAA